VTLGADTRDSPYRGLWPYEADDAAFFFGRERDTRVVVANLFASQLTVVYGPSGVGKTSLLQAGLLHALGARDDVVPALLRDWHAMTASALIGVIEHAAGGFGVVNEPVETFAQALAAGAQGGRRVMVVFDQFEEYLAHYHDEAVDRELVAAMSRPHPLTSFIVSLREDALAQLDRYDGRIPDLFENYLRIDHLSRSDAEEAIVGPLRVYDERVGGGIRAEPALVSAVLDDLQAHETAGGVGRGGTPDTGGIQTPYLQIVMSKLWEETRHSGAGVIEASLFERLGGARKIFSRHLDGVLARLTPEQQELAARAFEYLVTPTGWKIALPAVDVASYLKTPDVAAVESLLASLSGDEARILRPIPLPGRQDRAYEIYHDVLASAILEWRTRREHLATPVPRAPAPQAAEGVWAVVIGIDRYWSEASSLRGAVQDALAVREWLLSANGGGVPPENLILLLAPAASTSLPVGLDFFEATKDKIFVAINDLMTLSAGTGERLYFYFAGHGLSVRLARHDEQVLLASGFDSLDTDRSFTTRSLFEFFETTQFQDQFFVIDANRNVPWNEGEFEVGRWILPRRRDPGLLPVQQFILQAVSPGVSGSAVEWPAAEPAGFTGVLLDGLNGNGSAKAWDLGSQRYKVSWERLVKFVQASVERRQLSSRDGAGDVSQIPQEAGARGVTGRTRNPLLSQFPLDAFPSVRLQVAVEPETVVPHARVSVLDATATEVAVKEGIAALPVVFALPPQAYAIRATAPGGWHGTLATPVELYEPQHVTVALRAGEDPADPSAASERAR
jgi:hypothetical protein